MSERILVWDFPTRVFHWLLAVSFAGAFFTADSERLRDLHVLLGYTFAGLIAFRLVWGVLGTRYARFRSFAFAPRALFDYLRSLPRGSPGRFVGHNPAGALAIFAMLALGGVTALSGLAVYNDIGGEWLEEVHEGAAYAMLMVVALHICGVAASSFLHRENLVRAMVTGYKAGERSQAIRRAHAWLGALMMAVVLAFWVGYPQLPRPPETAQAGADEHKAVKHERHRHDEHG